MTDVLIKKGKFGHGDRHAGRQECPIRTGAMLSHAKKLPEAERDWEQILLCLPLEGAWLFDGSLISNFWPPEL